MPDLRYFFRKKKNTKKAAYIRLKGNSARETRPKIFSRNEGGDFPSTCLFARSDIVV